jgi:spore germination protein KC
VDIFGFGEAFHRKYKKEWKAIKHNWNEEFKNAEISLEVEAHLRNTGLQIRRPSIKRE